MAKFSNNFNRDFNWFLKVRNVFNFDGSYYTDVIFDKNGVSGKEAFLKYDSEGKLIATRHPQILRHLIKIKGSVNLHIKMYAEDRANGVLPKILFIDEVVTPLQPPQWFIDAVENQKYKFYK